MLLRGGMPVAEALDLVPGLMVSALRERVNEATRSIRSGRSIFDAFKNAGLTTPVSERMLMVGQRAGNMDEMMERIAAYYDEETSRALTTFVKAFEPLVMAVIGLLVGGIVVLMYIPIFEIAGRLQS
jgi:general secretion pathway protein F